MAAALSAGVAEAVLLALLNPVLTVALRTPPVTVLLMPFRMGALAIGPPLLLIIAALGVYVCQRGNSMCLQLFA
jgi:hypothetical protein